jgi:hypothetical protein
VRPRPSSHKDLRDIKIIADKGEKRSEAGRNKYLEKQALISI